MENEGIEERDGHKDLAQGACSTSDQGPRPCQAPQELRSTRATKKRRQPAQDLPASSTPPCTAAPTPNTPSPSSSYAHPETTSSSTAAENAAEAAAPEL